MKQNIKLSPAEAKRLHKELLQARHRLAEIENSRSYRLVVNLRRATNPVWVLKNIHRIPRILKAFPVEINKSTLPSATARPLLPGSELGSFMKYPNFKVLSVGTVPDLTIYCHHLKMEDDEWLRFQELGIDVVLIGDNPKLTDETINSLLLLKKNGIKFFTMPKAIHDLGHAKIYTRQLRHSLVVDLQKFNPIGIDDYQYKKEVGIIGRSQGAIDKDFILKHSALVCPVAHFTNEASHAQTVMNILSCGVLVLTEQSKTLKKLLPKDFKFLGDSKLKKSSGLTEIEWKKESVRLRRYMHLHYSPKRLIDLLVSNTSFSKLTLEDTDKISILLSTNRPENVDISLKNVSSQSYKNVELLLILHGKGFALKDIRAKIKKHGIQAKIFQQAEDSIFGDNLNLALDNATGFYITKMDDDDYYGPNHLNDLIAALEYSRASIVGKWTNPTYIAEKDLVVTYAGGREERYGFHLPGATILTCTSLLKNLRFGSVKRAIDSELFRRLDSRGGLLYSTHSLNFIRVRHNDGHTYKRDDSELIEKSTTKPVAGLSFDNYFA